MGPTPGPETSSANLPYPLCKNPKTENQNSFCYETIRIVVSSAVKFLEMYITENLSWQVRISSLCHSLE
jgi:hypothetical protein